MTDSAIADSTCLIVLDKIECLDILLNAFPRVIVSPAVISEVGWIPSGVEVIPVGNRDLLNVLRLTLGEGESEVISLATEHASSIAILDDLKARRVAERLSLRIVGTIGLVMRAKRMGLITEVEPILLRLKDAGFHMSEVIWRRALHLTREV